MAAIRVLIIEDNIYVIEELRTKLMEWGYHVIGTARNAKEGLHCFNNYSPDLVIIDIELKGSGMQGTEIAQTMRRKRNIPILFFTGVKDGKILDKTCIADPVRFVQKVDNDLSLKINLAAMSKQLIDQDALLIRHKEGQERLHYRDIHWCQSARGCTLIYLKNGQKRTYPREIGQFLLNAPAYILRIHRSHAINVDGVKKINKRPTWRVPIEDANGNLICELNVSEGYRAKLAAVI